MTFKNFIKQLIFFKHYNLFTWRMLIINKTKKKNDDNQHTNRNNITLNQKSKDSEKYYNNNKILCSHFKSIIK